MVKIKKKHGVKDPREGVIGPDNVNYLASNSEGTAIIPNFNYGDIKIEHKKAVEEVIKFLLKNKDKPLEHNLDDLKKRFHLIDVPMKKYEDSLWYNFTKNENIGAVVQGFRETTDENGKRIRIPHISFSSDLDYLDNMLQRFVKTLEYNIKESNIKK